MFNGRYWSPAYWAPSYFATGSGSTPPAPTPRSTDAKIRSAIRDLLMATRQFDDVLLSETPDSFPTSTPECRGANIDPRGNTFKPLADSGGFDGIIQTTQLSISFFARHESPTIRDAILEQLFAVAANALNGQGIAGATNPAWTMFKSAQYKTACHPDRRLDCIFEYQRLIDSWSDFDISDPEN